MKDLLEKHSLQSKNLEKAKQPSFDLNVRSFLIPNLELISYLVIIHANPMIEKDERNCAISIGEFLLAYMF